MKNLEMYGVQEMDAREMKEIDGGWGPVIWFLLGVLASEVLDREAIEDFKEGYNDFKIIY